MFEAHIISLAKRLGIVTADENGAVTVDWVVLTAGVIIFSLIVWSIVKGGIIGGASEIRNAILTVVPI